MGRVKARKIWRPPKMPPLDDTCVCSICGVSIDVPGGAWCGPCTQALSDLYVAQEDLESRQAVGEVSPYSAEDVKIMLASQAVSFRIEMHGRLRQQARRMKNEEWQRHQQRSGRKPDAPRAWLRQQDLSPGSKTLYEAWLTFSGLDPTDAEWHRFRRAYARALEDAQK